MAEGKDDLFVNHKLCGYILPIVSVSSCHTPIPFLTPCTFISGREGLGFQTTKGDLFVPIKRDSDLSSAKKRKRETDGGYVVSQLFRLLSNRCLSIKCRILRDFSGESEVRVVLLVDIYLPAEIWDDGWQFPNLGYLAGSFFKHVSCDWQARNSLLCPDSNSDSHPLIDENMIWSILDCHLLRCPLHSVISSDKEIFNLHKILKTLPILEKKDDTIYTRILLIDQSISPGIWDLADDTLTHILSTLSPKDLISISSTCHHFRALASSVVPYMKLKLFPHQVAAVEWMLKREHNVKLLPHPLYMPFLTDDGFSYHINVLSGEICSGKAPMIEDFHGGLFCDDPGLGKTITSLSVILKTHNALSYPPEGAEVVWCVHNAERKCGYYEINGGNKLVLSREKLIGSENSLGVSNMQCKPMLPKLLSNFSTSSVGGSSKRVTLMQTTRWFNYTQDLEQRKIHILEEFEEVESHEHRKRKLLKPSSSATENVNGKKLKKISDGFSKINETWIRCDACRKWRKITEMKVVDLYAAWFCSANSDPLYQSCAVSEETWNHKRKVTNFPGFYTKGTEQGKYENVFFFTNVLKEHSSFLDFKTMEGVEWLANLPHSQLMDLETGGLFRPPSLDHLPSYEETILGRIFQSLGLVKKVERNTISWLYPSNLDSLEFDLTSLKIALTKPLDVSRLYLSRATLIVVPANLVEHWLIQIQKHVEPGLLRVFVWNGKNEPPTTHNLAWDYDIVITTFNKLSAEWSLHNKHSKLMHVHWLRIILDEGHTVGSLILTNKFQMAVSLVAKNRWVLTGTPTPYTPTNQAGHLQPMLNFLHEEIYGQDKKSWENAILKPFEAAKMEGRSLLLALLSRIMIGARKENIKSIAPCTKKVTFIDFNVDHVRSYNELVVIVRSNILMADWHGPSSHMVSLLNPNQWRFRRHTIKNIRLSCCVAGHIKVTGQYVQDLMDIFVNQGLDPVSDEYSFIDGSLLHGCSCFRCKEWCCLPLVTPCMHLLCLECVGLDNGKCTYPGCGYQYEMQPPGILRCYDNPNPKWPVPEYLLDEDIWEPDRQSTSSSKVAYLVEKLKSLQNTNTKYNCFEEVTYGMENGSASNGQSSNSLHYKVVVFSQFLEHINVIEPQLTLAGIKFAGMYSPMHSVNKMKSLQLFRHDPTCMVLLMDGSTALSLDLSFVTHVFFMEPIWDRSMEEQVISRVHRIGATRPIYMETLAMRGTIEEQMLEFLQNDSTNRRPMIQEMDKASSGGGRVPPHRSVHDFAASNYLCGLSFVHKRAEG